MAINLGELKTKAMDVLEGVFHEAQAAEPEIWEMVATELNAVGVPAQITDAVKTTVAGLIADYKSRQTAPAAAEPAAPAAPATPAEAAAADDSAARFAASAAGAGTP
jgi:hypothetical protein